MLKKKPYFLLLIASVLFLVFISFSGKDIICINIHDTYYVIANSYLYWLFFIVFFLFSLIYIGLEKMKFQFIKMLIGIHVYGTLLSAGLFCYFNYKNSIEQSPKFIGDLLNRTDYNAYLLLTLMLIIFLQFLFIINIFASLLKKMRLLRASQ